MTCTKCNAAMPADSPGGLCPRCALMLGLATAGTLTNADVATTSGPLESSLTIGPYRTLRLLGAGGMGVVYLAEQTEPIRRQVALKIIKPGMGSEEIIRRFETERQALALMEHPNVAKVLDAGTTADGRPYFVMEYVPGIPITVYCDQKQLPAKDRLRLFGDVCRAIHHAHQKGVIHRDIKPSNVLVSERDGQPIVTVIDFGIAKAVDHRLAGETVFTQQGLIIGTPEYMSPEQASSSPDIDTTTDVYSLGVLLYELLTGVLPFDSQALRKEGLLEILRVIRETDPPRPVTRLRAMGDTAIGMAQRRDTTVGGLLKQVQGDLEWITMRALEKDRGRRYSSAAALADDIERHLHDEPVLAGAPSRLYQFGKFVRRNRVLAMAAAAVAAALVLGMALTTLQYLRAERQRVLAESNAREAGRERSRAEGEARRADLSAGEARGAQVEAEKSRDTAEMERVRAEAEVESGRRMLYAADMNRVSQAWSDANMLFLQELLERHMPAPGKSDLRGFEWFHWWRQSNSSVRTFVVDGPFLAFSPDGELLVTTGIYLQWGATKFWKVPLLRESGRSAALAGQDVAFAPDGTFFAIAALQGPITLRDPTTFREIATIPYVEAWKIAFSPDGSTLAVAAKPGNRLRFWDLVAKRERAAPAGTGGISSLSFSPDSKVLITASEGTGVEYWDVASGTKLPPLLSTTPNRLTVKFSPDGALIADAGSDSITNVWDVASKKKLASLKAEEGTSDLAFSPDGTMLATASADRVVRLYLGPTWKQIGVVKGHAEAVVKVGFSPDGKLLGTGGSEGIVRLWSVAGILADQGLQTKRAGVFGMAYSPDGRSLATGGADGEVTVWDVAGRKGLRIFPGDRGISQIQFAPNGTMLSVARRAGSLQVLNLNTGQELLHRAIKTPRFSAVSGWKNTMGTFCVFSPKSDYLVTGHELGAASLVHIASQREIAIFGKPEDQIYGASFSPDGSMLATSGLNLSTLGFKGGVDLWDVATRKKRFRLKTENPLPVLAFSPDGRLMASANAYYNVEIWETKTGRLSATLKGSTAPILALAFSRDGRRVMAAGNGPEVRIWDFLNGQQVAAIRPGENVSNAVFAPDGRTLAVGDFSGRIHLLDASSEQQVLAQAPNSPTKVE